MHFDFYRGQIETIPVEMKVGNNNHLTMNVKSSVCLKIYVAYQRYTSCYNEFFEIFIEDREYVFSTFLPEGISTIKYFTIENLSPKIGWFNINNYKFDNIDLPCGKSDIFIQNDFLKAGFSLSNGGGLSSFICKNKNIEQIYNEDNGKMYIGENYATKKKGKLISSCVNFLNRYDKGRLLQQSYYVCAKAPYQRGDVNGNLWRYNPVQYGDNYKNKSILTDYKITDTSVYIKIRPLDWAKNNCPTDSYMESTYTIENNYLHIKNRFIDFSKFDHYSSGKASQEIPALYVVEPLRKFVFKNSKGLNELKDLGFWGNVDTGMHQTYEVDNCCSAWLNEENFGVGLLVPGIKKFMCGTYRTDDSKVIFADKMDSTNYVAALGEFVIPELKPVEYECFICTGYLKEIQDTFCLLSKKDWNNSLRYILMNA